MDGRIFTEEEMKAHVEQAVQHTISRRDIKEIKDTMSEFMARFDKLEIVLSTNYVTRKEFEPVKNVTFGLVAIILTSVAAAILSLVIL